MVVVHDSSALDVYHGSGSYVGICKDSGSYVGMTRKEHDHPYIRAACVFTETHFQYILELQSHLIQFCDRFW